MPENTTSSERKLAGIMFTDIEGYTALMSQNEKKAIVLRDRHREVFERLHQRYGGKIVQYYGDGTLSIFDSCVEAANCAIGIQKELKKVPRVPLRIGIHLGDIVLRDDDVLGNGVNIASRVESLGTAGAIMISEAVERQIHNQGFRTVSLGRFQMKNLSKPIEVFALAEDGLIVPEVESLHGKGERLNTPAVAKTTDTRFRGRSMLFGLIAILTAMGIWLGGGGQRKESSQLLDESVREEKVAVNVFENRTDDENLDALGYLASEWISSGLRELDVRTVSPEMIRQNKDRIGILPGNLENELSFAEITGAKYAVTGSYFLERDSLTLITRLISTETGEELKTFPKQKRHKSQKEQLVEETRQYLLGYWVLKKNQRLPNVSPPKFEAYKKYLNCFYGNRRCYIDALEIDPNFLLARIYLIFSSGEVRLDSLYFANKLFVEQRWDQLTQFEKNHFHFATFSYEGNRTGAFQALNANYLLDPKDYWVTIQSASFALTEMNQADVAIKRFESIFNNIELYENQIIALTFFNYLDALNRKQQYKKAIDFYFELSEAWKKKAGTVSIWQVMVALIHLNRIDEVRQLINNIDKKHLGYLRASYIYSYVFPNASNNPFHENLKKQLKNFRHEPSGRWDYGFAQDDGINPIYFRWYNSKFLASYLLGDFENAEKILSSLKNYDWEQFYERETISPWWQGQEQLWLAAALGCVYAHQGRIQDSYAQIKKLETLNTKYIDQSRVLQLRGGSEYLKARIYAILGEKETAVEALRTSFDQGRRFYRWNFYFDIDFVKLKGYPPFEDLIKPEIMDDNL